MTTMYTPSQYRKIEAERDALLEASKRVMGLLDSFAGTEQTTIKEERLIQALEDAIERAEGRE